MTTGGQGSYTGIPREEIEWYPRIDREKCKPKECGFVCIAACPRGVYERGEGDVLAVAHPYDCTVGDQSCSFQCPYDAISFPSRQEFKEMIRRLRAQYPLSDESGQ